jgi:hypothetical protein
MPIGRTSRNVGNGVRDVRDAEGTSRGREQFHDGVSARGVALIDSAQMDLDEFVERSERRGGGEGATVNSARTDH